MDTLYRIINFVLLFGLLAFFCRNMIKNMFRGRRDKIVQDLKDADEAVEKAKTLNERIREFWNEKTRQKAEIIKTAEENADSITKEYEILTLEERERILEKAAVNEQELKKKMALSIEQEAINEVVSQTRESLKKPEFEEPKKLLNGHFINRFKEILKAMPGDILKMKELKKLDISVSSSQPATEEEMDNIKKIIADTFIDCHNEVDASLVGGLKVRIGDRVYDGSIDNQLNKLSSEVEKNTRMSADGDIEQEIKDRIMNTGEEIDVYETGYVLSLGDGIARVSGLSSCMAGEMLEFPYGLTGMVQDLDKDHVGVVLLGDYSKIEEGDLVKRTGKILEVPVGEALIGRVLDALGSPIDGKGAAETTEFRPVENVAPGVVKRQSVSKPLQTGIKAIDTLVPIGRGQRELIIGDRQTGKTALAIDAIINQKGQDVICIYVAIGQKESTVAGVVSRLNEFGAMDYTIVISASASEPAPMLYIAPYSGAAIGEYFMHNGKDVLIIYDDLTKQAAAYRELSLLLQRPPGREAYPGDIFYLHSRLLERAARLSDEYGGGSMTALPIIETQAGDISAYIPTNVISITDGQIFLESDLFHAGTRPAINVGLSVSRVGGAAQLAAMKQFSGRLRMDLAQYRELAAFLRFGSEVDKATQLSINRGQHMTEILKQPQYRPMDVTDQVIILYAGSEGFTDFVELDNMAEFEAELIDYVKDRYPEIDKTVKENKKLGDEEKEKLSTVIMEFSKKYNAEAEEETAPAAEDTEQA